MGSGKFGKLMSDLRESDPEKTSYSSLADRVWDAKFTPKGVERMSYALDEKWAMDMKIAEELGEKRGEKRGEMKKAIQTAERMLARGCE